MKQTWYQKEQQRKRMAIHQGEQHSQEHAHHEKREEQHRQESFSSVPSWLTELVDILEAIWAALPASESEPNHVVTQKLKAFKSRIPKHQ